MAMKKSAPAPKKAGKVSTNTDVIDLNAVAQAQNARAASSTSTSTAPKFGSPAWRAKYDHKK